MAEYEQLDIGTKSGKPLTALKNAKEESFSSMKKTALFALAGLTIIVSSVLPTQNADASPFTDRLKQKATQVAQTHHVKPETIERYKHLAQKGLEHYSARHSHGATNKL